MTNPKTEPIEVTVRGVKASIRKSRSGFVIWNDDSWLLGESGLWRSEDNQEDAIVFPSPDAAQAFVDRLNAEQPAPSPQSAAGETCRECNGFGWIGDNDAGAPECDCPTCKGSGKQPPAAPDEGVRERLISSDALVGCVAKAMRALPEVLRPANWQDLVGEMIASLDKSFAGLPSPPDLTRQLAAAQAELKKAEDALPSTFFGDRPLAERVKLLVDDWRKVHEAKEAAEERAEFLDRAWQQCNEARESAERELATLRQQLAEALQVVHGPAELGEGRWAVYHKLSGDRSGTGPYVLSSDAIAIRLPEKEGRA